MLHTFVKLRAADRAEVARRAKRERITEILKVDAADVEEVAADLAGAAGVEIGELVGGHEVRVVVSQSHLSLIHI